MMQYIKLIAFSTILPILCACQKQDQITPPVRPSVDVKVKYQNSMDIRRENNSNCIFPFEALGDIYQLKGQASIIDDIAMVQTQGLAKIVSSIKYNDGRDLYAIFLTEIFGVDSDGFSSCHACGTKLGIAVYQYHNEWRLLSRNPDIVDKFGSYGIANLNGNDNKINIIPIGVENFLITLTESDGGQGYENSSQKIIEVNSNKFNTNHPLSISDMGSIDTGGSDCGSSQPSEKWTGDIKYDKNSVSPVITVTKNYVNCAGDKINNKPVVIYKADGSDGKYQVSLSGS